MPEDNVVEPEGVASTPEPVGSVEPSTEPVQSASTEQEPTVDPSQESQEPIVSDDNPLEVMRQQADDRYRKLQGSKDREIAALQAQLNAPQAQAQPAEQDKVDEFNGRAFLDMVESGNENEAFDKMVGVAEQRAVARFQEQQQNAAYEQQFMTEFDTATKSYTEEEKGATVGIIQEHIAAGRPITPMAAAAMARFGSLDKALEYANSYAANSIPAPAAAAAPAAAPNATAPAPHHPPVIGLGGTKFSFGQDNQDGGSGGERQLEGLYRDL